jgi:acyl-CoA synthetase (AMP-forming)/AMP-acid ligase II
MYLSIKRKISEPSDTWMIAKARDLTVPIRRSGKRLYGPEGWGASDRTELIDFCRIAICKAPRFVEIVDCLSRNPGRILKRELRVRAAEKMKVA